jgi:hypothetical protein
MQKAQQRTQQIEKGSHLFQGDSLILLAGPTGLEPATSGVTGRCNEGIYLIGFAMFGLKLTCSHHSQEKSPTTNPTRAIHHAPDRIVSRS